MESGFAGIQNRLFFIYNTRMLFGDAKETVSTLVSEFKGYSLFLGLILSDFCGQLC